MKKVISMVVICCLIVCTLASFSVSAASQVEQIIAAGKSIIGSQQYNGYCQSFVKWCYQQAGIYASKNASYALQAWEWWGVSTSRNDIPVGACVYFDSEFSPQYGHVGIYLGDNKFIHAVSNASDGANGVKISTFSNYWNRYYKGWGWQAGIKPDGSSNHSDVDNDSHTCSGGKFLWYWSAHPHYNCYSCATCGKEWANKNETNYIASCSECNPPKQSASTTVSKWVTCKTKIKIPAGSPKTWVYRVPESDAVSNKTWDYFSTRTNDINFTSEKYAVLSNGRTRYQVNVSVNGETITAYINSTDVQVVNKYHTTSSSNFDTSHPHNKYTLCECGQKTYTGETKKVDGCNECYPKVQETKSNYYTITYNANGGSGAPNSETIPDYDGVSESIKISSKEPTRSGYTFLGWSTGSGASRAEYEGGDRYYIDKNTTFYAVWEKETEDNRCGNNMTWEYDKSTKTLKISGTGYMYDYDNRSRPWENIKNDVESIEIEDGIRDIGNCAFKDFENLEWLELPDSILAIGESAFSNCYNVEVWYDGTEDEFYEIDMESGNSTMRYDVTYNYYTVSFTNLKGNKISKQKVKKSSRAKQPSNISKDGYVFIGWYVNGEEYDFDDKVNKDIIISAEWEEEDLIIGTSNSDKIILTIGKKEAKVFGETIINDVAPVTRNGRTMLPARFVAEALGANVEWNEAYETVRIISNGYWIELIIGRADVTLYKYEYDGNDYNIIDVEFYTLDSCPFIENSRTYLPVRFIAEQLDAIVEWNEKEQQVIITKT